MWSGRPQSRQQWLAPEGQGRQEFGNAENAASRRPKLPSLADLIRDRGAVVQLTAEDKEEAFAEIVEALLRAGRLPGGKREAALNALSGRESMATTGIGRGVAVPHGYLATGENVVALGRSEAGLDWDALDDLPVHLVFLVLGDGHQRSLAYSLINQVIIGQGALERLRTCEFGDIIAIMAEWEAE